MSSAAKSGSSLIGLSRRERKAFAGVIIGWKSNLAQGYCSLSYLGYSGRKSTADFDRERERILQRYIERWAKGI